VRVQPPAAGNKSRRGQEKRLLDLFAALTAAQRDSLLDFAEFLVARSAAPPAAPACEMLEPRDIPRPAKESVVAAIKRLNATYAMLEEKAGLLDESAALMTQHLMHGRDLEGVIDALEAVFARHYQNWLAERRE